MKRIFFTAILLLLASLVFSQENIAVFPFENMENLLSKTESIFFYRQFSNEFSNKGSGRFRVIPRSDVDRLINTEAEFQLSDFSARTKTAEMNRVLNGTHILSGIIGKVGNRINISISLYTYPDLRQLPGGVDMRVSNTDELFDKIPELVRTMLAKISEDEKKIIPTEQKSSANAAKKSDPRLGIAFGNIFFGLGSYVSGDWAGGLTVTGGYLAAGGLIMWELFGIKYEDPLAGVIGPIGVGIGGLALVYGFARPYIRSKNPRLASFSDNFNIEIVSSNENTMAVHMSYKLNY